MSEKRTLRVEKDRPPRRFESHTWYVAKLESHDIGEGKFGDFIKLKFTVLGGQLENGEPAKGATATAIFNAMVSPKSPLYEFVQVFEDMRDLDIDEEIDFSSYYGKKVKVFIQDRKPKPGDDSKFQNVVKIKPYTKEVAK